MSRLRMTLTSSDMDNLSQIVQQDVKSIKAAAESLGVERAYVYRLLERVNKFLDTPELAWKQGTRFAIPPEIKRLARRLDELGDAIYEASHFPRISAGSMTSILLHQVVQSLNIEWRQIEVIRSQDIQKALKNYEIDLAIIHKSSIQKEINHDLEITTLLPWQAVIIGPQKTSHKPKVAIRWQSNSHSERLTTQVGKTTVGFQKLMPGPYANSNLTALEMIRRGLLVYAVLPNIYLQPQDRQQLTIISPDSKVSDCLIGVYRKEDLTRLKPFLDKHPWNLILHTIPS